MSCAVRWTEPPPESRWGSRRLQREEELFDVRGDERELLHQAEEAECRLMERVVDYEDAGRVVPLGHRGGSGDPAGHVVRRRPANLNGSMSATCGGT